MLKDGIRKDTTIWEFLVMRTVYLLMLTIIVQDSYVGVKGGLF